MSDRLFDTAEMVASRFSCNCHDVGHALDVCVELTDDGRVWDCEFNLYMQGKAPLGYRLRQIWRLLRGRDGQLADFGFRPNDAEEMIRLMRIVKRARPCA